MEAAASMIPGETSFNEDSTILATIGIAPIVSGTIEAVVPIDDPVTNRVNGMRSTSNIRNGKDLHMFTISPTTKLTGLFERIRPLSVAYNKIPIGSPAMYAKIDAKKVI